MSATDAAEAQKQHLRDAMDAAGVTDPMERAGIAAIAGGEGGFRHRTEMGYAHTSNDRIREIFGSRVAGLDEAELNDLKANEPEFFERVYGGRYGNIHPGDGFKYRGRGDFQLSFRANYEAMGTAIGVDLVTNPDLANDPAISARIAVAYIQQRYKGGGWWAMKRCVGNEVAATEGVKDRLFERYMASGEMA